MKLSQRQAIFSHNVASLIFYIFDAGYTCTFSEAYRPEEMAEIYAARGTGIKNSQHCKRLAVDLNLFSPEGEYLTKTNDYSEFGDYWKALDNENNWGGDFKRKDGNHFEMRG